MKKTFSFKTSNKTPERQADSIKFEIKKYLARERRKTLPENADYWDFDCRIGNEASTAKEIKVSEVNSSISRLLEQEFETFYLEILVKPGFKPVKP